MFCVNWEFDGKSADAHVQRGRALLIWDGARIDLGMEYDFFINLIIQDHFTMENLFELNVFELK